MTEESKTPETDETPATDTPEAEATDTEAPEIETWHGIHSGPVMRTVRM